MLDMSDAKNGYRFRVAGHMQQPLNRAYVEQRPPAHTQPFGARGQPDVLDGARDRREIHFRQRPAAEYMALAIFHQTDDHDLAAIQDALDLEPHEFVAA